MRGVGTDAMTGLLEFINCPQSTIFNVKFNVALVDTVIRRKFQGLAPNTHFGITYNDELQIRTLLFNILIQIGISNTNTLHFFVFICDSNRPIYFIYWLYFQI